MHYAVLGSVEARRDDVVIAIGGPQQRRLLALLLSRPAEATSADRLVDCLWPDGLAPVGANRSVMTYVSRLRAAIGESAISTVDEGYQLQLAGSTIDSVQFEDLVREAGTAEPGRALELYDRALKLWRGSAYGDLGNEWWLLGEASRLNEIRAVAMEERAEASLAMGHHHRVVADLERLSVDHPLRERPVGLLMQALFATGRHADALRVYQSFRARLADETGLEPSGELIALERALAAGRPIPGSTARARLLRGYVVHEVLGEGAFGRVFAATQPGTNREVAIKAIRPDLSDSAEFIQRFEAEAQLVARLEHPHIVPLYDYWREPGAAYLVFRLLLGGTALGSMINAGPFSVSRVSRLVEEVGSALLAAHSAGVVHCDIKPSNVIFDEAGNAYLSDFGIAVTSSTFDNTGSLTRAYAAPELAGRSGDTVQSDIFSFGCMLWELLVGTSPLSVMAPANRTRLPSLAGSITEASPLLDAVLARATAGDTGERYESMADLIVSWREAVGRPEGVLTPIGAPSGSQPNSSRRRAVRSLSVQVSAAMNPYKGLRPFTEADAADFFGREDVAAALYETMAVRSFVVVVGPSGSGKSSLVHAGLVPRLRHDGLRVATMVPGDRPTAAMRQALRQVVATDIDSSDARTLINEAAEDGVGQVVLVVDQFEECWTLADRAERDLFLDALSVADRFGVRCVATVRADLYDRPLQHALIGQMVADGTFALPPLTAQALEDIVARPAERNGVEFDDGVITAIVAEAIGQPAVLPLLQFAMAELYERRVDHRITGTLLQQLGGLGGAIGRRAESIYVALDDEMKQQARHLFGRLVAPGQGAPDTRRRARLGDLSELDRAIVDQFLAARLLVADRDVATREPVIEVAHEALLTDWPRLREWLDADRRWLTQLHHLTAASQAWDESGRADGELYRGSRLEGVLEALPEHEQQLSHDELAFIEASKTAREAAGERERRRSRRLRRLLVATACFLALSVLAGVIALTQRQQARTAATRAEIAALVGRSLSIRASQREVAALLAIEAYRLDDTPRTRSALLSTFTADVGYLGTNHLANALDGALQGIVMPDGKTTFVVGANQRIRPYDLDTGVVGDPWEPLIDVSDGDSRFVGSADGRLVAQIYWYRDWPDNPRALVGVFDTTTHRRVIGPIAVPFVVDNAEFSPDNERLFVSGGHDGTVLAFSVADGSEAGSLLGLEPPPDSYLKATTAGLAFVSGGLLAIGSAAGPIRLVDPGTLEVRTTLDAPRGTTEKLVAIDSGKALIGSGIYGRVRVNVTDESSGPTWTVGLSEQVFEKCTNFQVAEHRDRFYCGSAVGRLEERDLRTGGFVREMNAQNGANAVSSMWLARDGIELVDFNGNEALVARWRLDGSGPVSRRVGSDAAPQVYSPDGRLVLAYLGIHGEAPATGWAVVDTATGGRTVEGTGSVQFPDWRADGSLSGWIDMDTAPRLVSIDPTTMHIEPTNLTFPRSADGSFGNRHRMWLYFADDSPNGPGAVWTIDTETATRIEPTIRVDSYYNGSANESGDRLAIGTADGVTVFDGNTGETLHTFRDNPYGGAQFVAGNRLVDITADGEMTVYDLDSFDTAVTLGGLNGWGGIWSNDDGSVAMAAGYNSVILYDLGTSEQIGDPIIIPDEESVAFALRPDGKELAIGGGAGREFAVWDLDPQHWVTAACRVAGRNLTREEWDTNIGHLATYHRTCPEYT